jgi:zinc protease
MVETRIRQAEKVAGSPSEVGRLVYREAMLGDSDPYAHSVGGRPQTLQGLERDELVTFAQEYFDPSGFILTVVSPQEVEDVLGAVEERFGSAATHGVEIPTPVWPTTDLPEPPVRKSLGADQARLYLGRIAPLLAQDRPALSLLTAVLSDRLLMTLREREGLAYRLGATAEFGANPDQAWITVSIGTRSENLDAVQEGARREMARLAAEAADDEELDRIRSAIRSRALMRRMPAVNRARYLGLRAFRQVPSTEDPDFLEAMDRVTPQDLEKLAATWLDPSGFRVVIVD